MLNLLCSLEMKQWSLDDNTSVYNMRERERANEVAQLCPTHCDHLDCSLPGFSIHGIFQARVLEWFAISLSRGSSQPRDWTQVSHIAGRCFTLWATRERVHNMVYEYFRLIVENYCLGKKKKSFQNMLTDNAPRYPRAVMEMYKNDGIFMSANTAFILQPIDQGVISIFKFYYH